MAFWFARVALISLYIFSGGISIKPSKSMGDMRGDMGGAGCVAATFDAIANLSTSVNLIALIPMVENMPSGSAVKPGDVVIAMNGTSIEVGKL